MEESYLGEIKYFAGSFAPRGWMFCEGQRLAVSQFKSLFDVIGTTYGGDGVSTFSLPDLRGRIIIGANSNYPFGFGSGSEEVALTSAMIPSHTHTARAKTPAGAVLAAEPTGNYWAGNDKIPQFVTGVQSDVPMSTLALSAAGGGEPHNNMPPFLVLNFIICVDGVVPPRG